MKINRIRYIVIPNTLLQNVLWDEISSEVTALSTIFNFVNVIFYKKSLHPNYKYISNFVIFIINGKLIVECNHLTEFNR